MTWDDIDWNCLARQRERFLDGSPGTGPYWASASDLENYDFTYGERIGWKWDAVLDELDGRKWRPSKGAILDWGCGSGVASRRVIEKFGPESFTELHVWDHSELARSFARNRAVADFPGLAVSDAKGIISGDAPIGLLVISHVLNELSAEDLSALGMLSRRSRAVLWTEPGSREISRSLGSIRDQWGREFRVVAPCTHSNPCPIREEGNERHWCHHFAPPPPLIFADSNWVKFGQRAGIDLRSLPYAFIALDRDWPGPEPGLSRVIGRPEHFKPYARLLNCDSGGLSELTAMKRENPGLYKELEKTKRPLVYRWSRKGAAIESGEAIRPRS